ncbi:nuclease [Leptolyngbya sp. 'hensonii']|uniref:DNA double-strand break repair nuclease NurA n=1 Tax=Leptolyngbya sp. 'hensonii' TaxID=1922337 RepID=UPI00094F8831|nr:DNA double-strand break repair nuclease NurA [Leptolyngbya sp. 'hensonii']OLP15984.1 nuclease [Leptolyngbya sp. 'hensonii']
MLDLTQIAQQMQGISQHLTQEATATRQRLELAQRLLAQVGEQQAHLVQMQETWRDRLGFSAAIPIEPLATRIDLDAAPACHTVIATDGSQIAPSHHEIAYCYLINVGRVVLHYGQNRYPLMDSRPEVFYRPEDLYTCRQWGLRTEEWMGYQRTVSEAVALAELASSASPPSPTLAMVDGSLIYWFLESIPAEARDRILLPILQAWEQLQQANVPLVGYLSASRSGESLNFLRLKACPYGEPDCATHCPGQTDRAPCQVLDPLKDTAFWATLLKPGQRSPIWSSAARILDLYGPHRVYFCYVHVGHEIARIEFPAWVAAEATLLQTALSLALTQVQKGYGYPVTLAEAHNQAVVRGGDRARFFALLEQQMIRTGLRNIGPSYKETRKRGSIA